MPVMFKLLLVGVVAVMASCTYTVNPPKMKGPAHHAVLRPGEWVEFKNSNGSGAVRYVSDFTRQYDVFDESHQVALFQRTEICRHQEGIYNPGQTYSIGASRRVRFVVQESVVYFKSLSEVDDFLAAGSSSYQWGSNSDGYVLGFFCAPSRYQANIDLFRFYLNGKLMRTIPKQHRYPGYVRVHKTAESGS
jgi:hypothetical protein